LEARYAGDASVSVVLGDVLETPPGSLGGGRPGGYVVVGNVPYYITTPIIFQALEAPRPKRAVFLVQREVAERIVAPPGGKTYGSLSVKAGAFQPAPSVESAVVRLTPLDTPLVPPDLESSFRGFVQDVFGLRRKQM